MPLHKANGLQGEHVAARAHVKAILQPFFCPTHVCGEENLIQGKGIINNGKRGGIRDEDELLTHNL